MCRNETKKDPISSAKCMHPTQEPSLLVIVLTSGGFFHRVMQFSWVLFAGPKLRRPQELGDCQEGESR